MYDISRFTSIVIRLHVCWRSLVSDQHTFKRLYYLYHLFPAGNVFGDCDSAPLVAGAFHNGSVLGPYSEGVVLRYLCSLAYDRVLGGSNYYQCSSEVWTGGNLTCTLGSCGTVEPEPNSYIVGQAGYYVGNTTTFSCYEGYNMNGNDLIKCMADRRWSPEPPTCVKVRCPEFSTPDAQIFQDFSGVRNEFGSKNKITCTGGTVLQGPQYITCLANKTWSGSPSCTVPNCGNPPASYEPCTEVFYTDGNTNIGSQVEVICLENAVPSGTSPFLICTATVRWSHEYHCLCGGCRHDCDGTVNTGPRNVTNDTEIDCPCPDGNNFKRKCLNGTFETKTSCRDTQPTTLPVTHNRTPLTQDISNVFIAIIVTCVLACTIVIAAVNFFCCPWCKTRRTKLHARCKLCFQDENSKDNIPPETVKMTAVPLVAKDY
ncbi:hypothetical protein ACJMK2_036539 [Sinanodonta woodiana]|uniref:Sushi domain-containing protein n=1 Tax=Sinanodonta woodiana TaxID=1069815 RepID=A0ABD3WHI5_SINWO